MRNQTKSYTEIREFLDNVPVIETHEHYTGVIKPEYDILNFLMNGYIRQDVQSAAFEAEKEVLSIYTDIWHKGDDNLSFEQRFRIFKQFYGRTDKTAYARGMQIGLKKCWDMEDTDEISDMDAAKVRALEKKLAGRTQAYCDKLLDDHGIKAMIVDIFDIKPFIEVEKAEEAKEAVEGAAPKYSKLCKFAFPLPPFHKINSKADITNLEGYTDRRITCLDDYLSGFDSLLKKSIGFGVVCIKDQSAYRRTLDYSNPSRGEAEKVFGEIIMSDPRRIFGDDEVRVLDDWLFNYFMRQAADYGIPVQLHTGHLAGVRNDIRNANAVKLIPSLELHQDVRFDLFHGNWPYMDEYLFLGKNYPNVWLDLCWVQSIDPLYCVELMKRALLTVPHAKLMAFGGDCRHVEWTIGYLCIARDNTACALSEMVESGWINLREARQIAADWFFNNPNEFFGLGFKRFAP